MEIDLFKKIIDQAKLIAEEAIFHVVGEPLLHPELEQYIDYTLAAGMKIMLVTNGTLLNVENTKMIASKNIRQVNISLQAIQTLEQKELYLQEIFEFVKHFQNNNNGFINLRLWNVFSVENSWIIEQINNYFKVDIILPKTLEELKHWKSFPMAKNTYLHIDSSFEWPDLQKPVIQTKGSCYGLDAQFAILVDGSVVPCCLDSEGAVTLGNIKNDTLEEILLSPRAQSMRKGFQQKVLVEELCQRCGYRERFK